MDLELCKQPERPNVEDSPVAELYKCLTVFRVTDEDENGLHHLKYVTIRDSLVDAEYYMSRWLCEDSTQSFVVLLTYMSKEHVNKLAKEEPCPNIKRKGFYSHIKTLAGKYFY